MNNVSFWKQNAIKFLSGQAVSIFGSSLVQYAIIWHITLQTKSGVLIMISTICGFLPQAIISIFGGVWADRYDRKKMIILADGSIAVATLVIAVLFLLGINHLGILILALAVRSLGSGVQAPAVNAFVPQIVPEGRLVKVNGIHTTIQSLVMFVSPAASAGLLALARMEFIFLIDVITAAIGIFLLYLVREEKQEKSGRPGKVNYLEDVLIGMRYIRDSRFLRKLVLYYSVFGFLVVPSAFLTPLMIARNFGDAYWMLSANEMVFFAGSIGGGILISTWGGFKNKIHSIAAACVLFGVFSAVLGLASGFFMYLIAMGLIGISIPFFNTPSTTLLQETVDEDKLGRVFSLVQIISVLAMPFGMVVFGPLSDKVNIGLLMIITGVLISAEGIFILKDKDFSQIPVSSHSQK